MELQNVYVKPRAEFGKCCNFEEKDKLETDIKPNTSLMHSYVRVDPVTQGTQCSRSYAAHEVLRSEIEYCIIQKKVKGTM